MEEKIATKKEQISKLESRIERDREKIKKLEGEIEEIKVLEIKGVIKEIDMPLSEALKILKELK
jgi:predicted RNase H-like nuclease (RuvC/YqgF family)